MTNLPWYDIAFWSFMVLGGAFILWCIYKLHKWDIAIRKYYRSEFERYAKLRKESEERAKRVEEYWRKRGYGHD